ncbi:hypothetical protein L195_g057384 [Trifolium pratense]|uniref:Uncharacterized protein n=1 Tax=Trifolium pratense TaxID=57577 RepID=A0A2K3KVW0_TRIPR|nr:hypothetical protein L195_g057384 [Trifolium pratense]
MKQGRHVIQGYSHLTNGKLESTGLRMPPLCKCRQQPPIGVIVICPPQGSSLEALTIFQNHK